MATCKERIWFSSVQINCHYQSKYKLYHRPTFDCLSVMILDKTILLLVWCSLLYIIVLLTCSTLKLSISNVFFNLYPGLLEEERLASAHQAEAFTRQIQRLQGNNDSEYSNPRWCEDYHYIRWQNNKAYAVCLWGVNFSFKILRRREVNFPRLSNKKVMRFL